MDTSRRAASRPGDPSRGGRRRSLLLVGLLALLVAAVGTLVWSWPTAAPDDAGTAAGEVEPEPVGPRGEEPETTRKTPPPAPRPSEPNETPTEAPDGPPAPPSEPPGPLSYSFPVEPAGAASYGRDHHTYPATDLFAACGTALVAVTDGVVDEVGDTDEWEPEVDDPATRSGRFVSIVGDDGVRYYLSHLEAVAPGVTAGRRVAAGQPIGSIGRSGNARETPCHAHFGISPPLGPGDWEVRRGVIWPWPYLDAWRAGRHASPADEVASWSR